MEKVQTSSHYELLRIVLEFISTVIWPISILIIILIYRKTIQNLLNRAKKIELPGGVSFETVDSDIQQAKELAKEMVEERKPEIQQMMNDDDIELTSKANKRMVELGLTPSPSGLNLSVYKDIADVDPRLALMSLKTDFQIMLRNLAKGFDITLEPKESLSKLILKLYKGNALTVRQYEFITTIFKISNSAARGIPVSKEQAYEVFDIGQVLVDDYVAWLSWGFKQK